MPRLVSLPCLIAFAVAAGACGRQPDTAPPVATPTVALSRTDAPVGSPIDLTFRFTVAKDAPAFDGDYWVFVHFVDADGELLWTEDHQPPTPIREWKPGATIEYARTGFIPRFPDEGQAVVEVGLFSPSTGMRLPLAGETRGDRSYQVATLNLRLETPVPIAFGQGWHDLEAADDAIGLEWQWSMREGTLLFPNPKRDAEFFLQLDQPVTLGTPQHVEVRLGGAVVDAFMLPPGATQIRRVKLTAAQFGGGETASMTIVVDRTFVPATIPALRNSDVRELGVRVFRAFLQPA